MPLLTLFLLVSDRASGFADTGMNVDASTCIVVAPAAGYARLTMPSFHDAISIHRARQSDLDALAAMEITAYRGDRLSRTQFRRHIDSDTALVLVASGAKHLLGNAVVFFRKGARVARLYSLTVAPAARGHGIGRRLLDAAEHAARRRHCTIMQLEVRIDNTAAIALYEQLGYQRLGRRPAYYDDGADAWKYSKALIPIPDSCRAMRA